MIVQCKHTVRRKCDSWHGMHSRVLNQFGIDRNIPVKRKLKCPGEMKSLVYDSKFIQKRVLFKFKEDTYTILQQH